MNWQQAIKDYQNYLRIERGLSANSVASYTLDIKKLVNWLDENSIEISSLSISEETLQQFIYQHSSTTVTVCASVSVPLCLTL